MRGRLTLLRPALLRLGTTLGAPAAGTRTHARTHPRGNRHPAPAGGRVGGPRGDLGPRGRSPLPIPPPLPPPPLPPQPPSLPPSKQARQQAISHAGHHHGSGPGTGHREPRVAREPGWPGRAAWHTPAHGVTLTHRLMHTRTHRPARRQQARTQSYTTHRLRGTRGISVHRAGLPRPQCGAWASPTPTGGTAAGV